MGTSRGRKDERGEWVKRWAWAKYSMHTHIYENITMNPTTLYVNSNLVKKKKKHLLEYKVWQTSSYPLPICVPRETSIKERDLLGNEEIRFMGNNGLGMLKFLQITYAVTLFFEMWIIWQNDPFKNSFHLSPAFYLAVENHTWNNTLL